MQSGKQRLIEEAKRALEEERKIPPAERFMAMVRRGLIDRQGRVTRWYGGDAEPDPEAVPPPHIQDDATDSK